MTRRSLIKLLGLAPLAPLALKAANSPKNLPAVPSATERVIGLEEAVAIYRESQRKSRVEIINDENGLPCTAVYYDS